MLGNIYAFHNGPIIRRWCFLQDRTTSNISDGCDTRPSSSRLHAGTCYTVLLTRHAQHCPSGFEHTWPTWSLSVFLGSWAPRVSPMHNRHSLHSSGDWLLPLPHFYRSESEAKRGLVTCTRDMPDIRMRLPSVPEPFLFAPLGYFLCWFPCSSSYSFNDTLSLKSWPPNPPWQVLNPVSPNLI